ncbi:hypothetical protein, variant 2 [Aphanomyces astaci]|uniref:Cysteine/serine-rich nuclear protein N-terminal domain-containing protein n=2 Tax=Aphanomyces astaci TaxID=112090 RepID=W4G2G8_APHAT|nr:hypothetical protein, variant 1 [Aphanomyces astaci]XP_009837319.1 hypothetical protein H257_11938 [Aphanomyces astaci]XP_009837320.1 hypothetical protein, variant 2 [Aphanomyces astaci]ETV73113.1 hypothetical protein H257_11938 [Aphanomyces astaci]ETV73114.1 hypothetical protein, variant 1 [Aphanomyces astaci]ETV73115.1 hypothetical protein, variant 2 [Aphanomyces astaci]|eukprot:XP_009837318.1 hypothetical protein, variant 1 [Aphanomyces astaci]
MSSRLAPMPRDEDSSLHHGCATSASLASLLGPSPSDVTSPFLTATSDVRSASRPTIPPIRGKRPRTASMDVVPTPAHPSKKKSLCFSSVTTFVFPLDYGGSAIPECAGPPIGLAAYHVNSTTVDISSNTTRSSFVRSTSAGNGVHRFSHLERVRMLKAAKYTGRDIAYFCSEATDIRSSREETQEQWVRAHKERPCIV